jgi:hypothetical protein
LWPADQPWIETPLVLPVPDNHSGQAEWQISKKSLPASAEYEGAYLGEMAIVDPWSGLQPQRPKSSHETTLLFEPEVADVFYELLDLEVKSGEAPPEQALIALAHQHRTQHFEQMYNTNYTLWKYAKELRLDPDQLLLWADFIRDLNDQTAYKLVEFSLFSEESVLQLETMVSDDGFVSRYLAHLPDGLPDTGAYLRLMVADFAQVRQQCIINLCHKKQQIGLEELLEDVQAGRIMVSAAAAILTPVYDFARDHLVQEGSTDAFDVLHVLTRAANEQPLWIELGYTLETNIGSGKVTRIKDLSSGEKVNLCWANDDCELVVKMDSVPDASAAFVNLRESKIHFGMLCLYQCSLCGEVTGATNDSAQNHFRDKHPYESPTYRQAKPPVFELTEFSIHFPGEGAEDEPSSN